MDVLSPILAILGVAIKAVEAVAPSVARAFTGGRTADEAIASANEAASKIPKRTEQGDADLEARKERG
jgi:hypothetical protein